MASRRRLQYRRQMPNFDDDMRPFLMAISTLSGPEYRDVGGDDLDAELRAQGHQHSETGFANIMRELKAGGMLTCSRDAVGGPSTYSMIRLTPYARELVEGWPTVEG